MSKNVTRPIHIPAPTAIEAFRVCEWSEFRKHEQIELLPLRELRTSPCSRCLVSPDYLEPRGRPPAGPHQYTGVAREQRDNSRNLFIVSKGFCGCQLRRCVPAESGRVMRTIWPAPGPNPSPKLETYNFPVGSASPVAVTECGRCAL